MIEWVLKERERQLQAKKDLAGNVGRGLDAGPFIVGINGPQGAGKTTLTTKLVAELSARGLRAVTFSIDDFYLTRLEQVELAKRNSSNPYLQNRGYPGTHDIALGEQILSKLKRLEPGQVLSCPIYDKSAHQGKGDRAPLEEWKPVQGPLDVIFLEGWMLGFRPVAPQSLKDPNLKVPNEFLGEYERWIRLLDAFVHLQPLDYRYVVDWRVEAEEKMKAAGKPGMSREETETYIQSFLIAYETYLPGLAANLPCSGRNQIIKIAKDRSTHSGQ